ncbi:heme NO-binding domain-containing protein [Alteromonas facilis]|uniref:heme NO-binding domain-containing protein n=1 Tax=Alteromonas facilis TaxID=2048004 RepID=UPI000C28FAE7|nr:heme NO-binding domain-containing protein [Alteromonas facilis]
MKGIVFDEFVTMVEQEFGDEMLDTIIEKSINSLPSKGAYTSVGTYDHNEILVLVSALSLECGEAVPELVKAFGKHLSKAFLEKFPDFFSQCNNAIDFFKTIDAHIHQEVHKLYPDAELPSFTFKQSNENHLELIYESSRDFSMLALGLLEGTAEHYGQMMTIEMTRLPSSDATRVRFDINSVEQ